MKNFKIADRLDDIASELLVAQLEIEGVEAETDRGLLGPVITYLGKISAAIRALSYEVHPVDQRGLR